MSAYDMMNEKKKPVYPTLEEGAYAEDVERGIAEAEKKAAEIEKQAKRDRDMALIGDMAHLVSQGAAMHGGAWKIGQTQNESAKGNERLRQLREKNAAQTAAFAKERAALMEAKRKEQNAQKLARYNAELEAYKSAQTQANADRDFAEKKRHNEETEKNNRAREQRLAAQGGRSGKEKNMRYLGDWGFDIDSAVDVDEAYYKLISSNPEFKVTEDRSIAEGGGEKLVKNPNTAQKRAKLIESGLVSREPKKTASVKKANPMGGGKKTNPMN